MLLFLAAVNGMSFSPSLIVSYAKISTSDWKMEFDHLPEYKKLFTIGGNGARDKSLEQIQAEMDKCEIVCRNCHADRTYWRQLKNGEYDDTISYYE